jgi:hypothetical protein
VPHTQRPICICMYVCMYERIYVHYHLVIHPRRLIQGRLYTYLGRKRCSSPIRDAGIQQWSSAPLWRRSRRGVRRIE